MKDRRQITPAEFQILEVLWRRPDPQSVADVLEVLQRSRRVAYTTVMTLLDKLARKGSVRRSRRGKAFLYRPAVQRAEVLDFLLEDFASCYLDGDRRQLAALANGQKPLAPPPARPAQLDGRRSLSEPEPEDPELDVALL